MPEYVNSYKEIIGRIKATRQKESIHLLLSALSKVVVYAGSAILTVSFAEMLLHGDIFLRSLLFFVFLAAMIYPAIRYLVPAAGRLLGIKNLPSADTMALRIGALYPEIKDKLCNSLQVVSSAGRIQGTSPELAYAAFNEVSAAAKDKDFDAIIDKDKNKNYLLLMLAAVIITAGSMGIFRSSMGEAFYRVMNFGTQFVPPAPFTLLPDPLEQTAIKGENALITIRADGKAPEKITLNIKEEKQDNYDQYTLRLDSGNIYRYEIMSARRPVIFFAEAWWLNSKITSETGRIDVVERPMIRALSGSVVYPQYTNLAARNFDERSADISALKGSLVRLRVLANKEIDEAYLVLVQNKPIEELMQDSVNTIRSDTFRIPMRIGDRVASAKFLVTADGSYHIEIFDKFGEKNRNPISYGIVSMTDAFPTISLLQPTMNVQVNESALLPVRVSISDDYGFSALKLHYKMVYSNYAAPDEEFRSIGITIPGNSLSSEVPYLWDLSDLDISPEDTYEFYLEVFDNDVVSGPKAARTRTLMVRLPSLDEVLKETDLTQQQIQKDLEEVLKDTDKIKKEMDELNRELLKDIKKKEVDWRDKKKVEEINKKQAELKQKLDDVRRKMEEMTRKLQENNVLSPETLAKFLEMQRLMQEVNSPELRRLQTQMENAMKQVSPEQMKKAMEQAKFNEEQFRKSIERTMKILKRLQAEQKVDAMTKRAEELRDKQKDIEKQAENSNPNDEKSREELAKQQEQAQKDLERMMEEMKELEKLMNEIGEEMPLDQLEKAKQELNPEQTMQQMQQSSSQCKSGNFSKAKKSQQSSSKNLQKFAEEMKKLKQQMEQQSARAAMRQMEKAVSDMLELSEQQEELQQNTQSTDYNSTQIPMLAQTQAEIYTSLANVANSMMQLAEKSFAFTPEMGARMGEAMQKMQSAIGQLAERRPNSASKSQGDAMASMNEAVSRMQNMLSAMQENGGSCTNPGGMGQGNTGKGSFGQQLQRLAQQQQGINAAMQQLSSMNQGKLSMEQQAEMGRIAGDQGKAAKSAQQLAKEQREFSDGEKKALGDLQKIAEEMEEVAKQLESGNVTPELMRRQNRILSRLLDAQRSVHERDYEKKRESKEGKQYRLVSPDEIDLRTQEGRKRAMEDMIRQMQQGYTKDYEILIRKYFEALQVKENGTEQ